MRIQDWVYCEAQQRSPVSHHSSGMFQHQTSWRYRALDEHGQERQGVVTAAHPRVAARILRERGLYAVAITAGDPRAMQDRPLGWIGNRFLRRLFIRMRVFWMNRFKGGFFNAMPGGKSIVEGNPIGFCDQKPYRPNALFYEALADLLEAGLTLDHALAVLARTGKGAGAMSETAAVLAKAVREGVHFPDALRRWTKCDACHIELIAAAGMTGRWGIALRTLARWERRRQEWRRRLIKGFLYPLWLFAVGCLTTFVMMRFVIPQMKEIYQEWNAPIPWLTQTALSLIDRFIMGMPFALFFVGMVVVVLLCLRRTSLFQRGCSRILWRQGLWRFCWSRWHSAVIFDALGFLVQEGVGLIEALDLAAHLSPLKDIKEKLKQAAVAVAGGRQVESVILDLWPMSETTAALLHCGCAAERIDEGFIKAARQAEKELVEMMEGKLARLEPLLLTSTAAFIALTMGVFLWPLFNVLRLMDAF